MIDRPHFAFPFTFNTTTGSVDVVEQDTIEHINACCQVIIRCPLGFRIDRPEFGWPFPEFATVPIDTTALVAALEEFEPRGRPNAREYMEAADAAVRGISVDVETEV